MNITILCVNRLVSTVGMALIFLASISSPAQATEIHIPAGYVDGAAYLTYDQDAWATMRSESFRTDIHGSHLNNDALEPTSNTFGNRYLYPQLFAGTDVPAALKNTILASDYYIDHGIADPEAVAQWRIFDPAQRVPLAQPAGGWAMPVDSFRPGLDQDNWGDGLEFGDQYSGYTPSNYDPDPNAFTPYLISLGGSLRMASDFIAPGGVLWARGLDIRYSVGVNASDYAWFIGANASVSGGNGSIFELINPVFGVNANGLMTLEADYKWGDSDWSNFFGFTLEPDNAAKVLGHISLNPSLQTAPVPLPSAVWLFGSVLLGLVGFRRRKSLS